MAGGKFSSSRRKKPEKLNITSLMDALTIILIFLLVNYSEVTEESGLPKFIELPSIKGELSKAKIGIKVVVGKDFIKVGKDRKVRYSDFDSERNQVMVQVKDELELLKKEALVRNVASDGEKAKDNSGIKVSVHADKSINYKIIDAVVSGAAELSLNFIDFVAQNEE